MHFKKTKLEIRVYAEEVRYEKEIPYGMSYSTRVKGYISITNRSCKAKYIQHIYIGVSKTGVKEEIYSGNLATIKIDSEDILKVPFSNANISSFKDLDDSIRLHAVIVDSFNHSWVSKDFVTVGTAKRVVTCGGASL